MNVKYLLKRYNLFHRIPGIVHFSMKFSKTRNAEHGTRNVERGTWNTERGTRNTERGTRNVYRSISFVVSLSFLVMATATYDP